MGHGTTRVQSIGATVFAASFIILVYGSAHATTSILRDRNAFIQATGANIVAGFEDLAVGTHAPFTSNGAQVMGEAEVLDSLVNPDLPHAFWFPDAGSPPNFVIANAVVPGVLQVVFPGDVTAAGFDFTCFGCDNLPNDSSMDWTLRSETGSVIAEGSAIYDFSNWHYTRTVFLGIISTAPFRSLTVSRRSVSRPQGGGNWLADDLRYVPVGPVCDIALNKASFVNGDPVIAQTLRVANPTAVPLAIEFKFWIDVPTMGPISYPARGGADGSVVLPAGFHQDFGPLPLFTVESQFPRGTYSFNCRFVDPVTGRLQTEDINPFTIP